MELRRGVSVMSGITAEPSGDVVGLSMKCQRGCPPDDPSDVPTLPFTTPIPLPTLRFTTRIETPSPISSTIRM